MFLIMKINDEQQWAFIICSLAIILVTSVE